MTVKNGAALIHCRTKYCDFPGKMFQYPADFTPAELYGFRTMILQTTREAEELRQTHRFRCVVIAAQKHIVLGVTGYLNDMLKEAGRCYEDEGGRPVCGFFGLSWKREEMPVILADGFPSLESFCAVVRRWVLPRWEARYWQQPQASEYDMEAELIPFSEREKEIRGKWQRANVFRDRLKIYPPDQGEQLLQQVMAAAVKENRAVSGCTGFTGAAAAVRSSFMNVSCEGIQLGRIVVRQRKRHCACQYILWLSGLKTAVSGSRLEKRILQVFERNARLTGQEIRCRVMQVESARGIVRVQLETDRRLDRVLKGRLIMAVTALPEIKTCRMETVRPQARV